MACLSAAHNGSKLGVAMKRRGPWDDHEAECSPKRASPWAGDTGDPGLATHNPKNKYK